MISLRYVMEKFNLPSDQAHTYVLTRRHCISINEGFRNQIRRLGLRCEVRAACICLLSIVLSYSSASLQLREYEMLHRVETLKIWVLEKVTELLL